MAGGATAHATGGTATATGGSATSSSGSSSTDGDTSVTGLARRALDSIKKAGGSPGLEDSITSVTKAALGEPEESGYENAGGSGPQASLQTGSKLHSSSGSETSMSSLAKHALDALEGESSSAKSPSSSFNSGSGSDSLSAMARKALDSLDGKQPSSSIS